MSPAEPKPVKTLADLLKEAQEKGYIKVGEY
jgi:hypothetical protein